MSVLKRNAAVIVLAGLVLGGAAVAWAGDNPARPTVLAAAQTDESAPPTTPPAPLTDEERRARREALRACLEAAGEDAAARQACIPAGARKGPGHPGRHGRPGPLGGLGLLGRAVHGSAVVPGAIEGTWQTVTFDRGRVEAATDGSKIVLARPDGETVTLALTADTRYHGIADAAGIKEGQPALVISKDATATQVVQRDPAHRKPPVTGNKGDAPVVPND